MPATLAASDDLEAIRNLKRRPAVVGTAGSETRAEQRPSVGKVVGRNQGKSICKVAVYPEMGDVKIRK
jgi:hypothetical protein